MGKTTESRLCIRVRAARQKAFVRAFSRFAPYYLINEFPKSGGTWLAQMLAEALDLPFRRNQPVRIEASVTHGHYLSPTGLANVVVLWRDPRDVLVSFYYHCYFIKEFDNAQLNKLMKLHRPFDDYDDLRANMPDFIRFVSTTPLTPSFSWPSFAEVWADRPGTVQATYEALRADTPGELARIVEALTGRPLPAARAVAVAEAHSFARTKAAADRAKTADSGMSFVREGALGGWTRHFTPEAEAVLAECGYASPMARLGYT